MLHALLTLALLFNGIAGGPALPPCPTDETEAGQPACYWNAATRGNHAGISFIWTGTELHHGKQA